MCQGSPPPSAPLVDFVKAVHKPHVRELARFPEILEQVAAFGITCRRDVTRNLAVAWL